nr:methyl-accepting chemotaxis protein [Pelomonas sp. P8]
MRFFSNLHGSCTFEVQPCRRARRAYMTFRRRWLLGLLKYQYNSADISTGQHARGWDGVVRDVMLNRLADGRPGWDGRIDASSCRPHEGAKERPMTNISGPARPWKIAHQLMLAFGIAAVLMAGIGVFSLTRLRELSTMQTNMYKEEVVPLALLRTASWQAATHFRRSYPFILKADEASRAETLELNRKSADEVLKAVSFERAHPVGPAHEQLLAEFDTLWQQYTESVTRLQKAASAGDNAAAFDELNKATDPLHVKVRKLMVQLGEMREASARDRAEAGAALVTGQARWLTGMVVISLALAGLAAWWVTRRITRALGAEPAEAQQFVARIAAGDLMAHVERRSGDDSSLVAHLALMREQLSRVIAGVRDGADQVACASSEIAQGNLDLSQRTERQASALEETASAMEELGSTVHQSADSAHEAERLALDAGRIAQQGGETVRRAVDKMGEIREGSSRIAEITGMINGLAFQTNLLALNAAVEAARAGEQGRGFAVVAAEVRSLAQRSAEAAKQISQLINASVSQVGEGVGLVQEAGTVMVDLRGAIQRVETAMSEISVAAQQQRLGIDQVGAAVQDMDQATQQNAALVEQTAAAATSLQRQASRLVDAVSVFRLEATR